jgi:hypothetical protein
MRKFIYKSVTDKLKELEDAGGQPVIRHFDLWNNNMAYIRDEQPFYLPAVLLEFQTIQWRHQGGGVREAAVTVVLHVLTQRNAPTADGSDYEGHALQFFDLLTHINRCLHAHCKTSSDFRHDALTALQSITDHDFEEIQHNIEIFTCHACDCAAMPARQVISAVKPEINIQ